MSRRYLSIFSALCLAFLAVSCVESVDGDDEQEPIVPDLVGASIFVPNTLDTVVRVTMDLEADWKLVENTATWYAVSPLSGVAGTAELSITVLSLNEGLSERVGSFILDVGGEQTQYFVIQDPVKGFSPSAGNTSISVDAQEVVFTLNANVDFEAVSDSEWLTVNSVESDSTLLSDGTTYSSYKTYTISMSASANDGDVREATVALNGVDGVTNATLTVAQMGDLVADFTKPFYRRTLAFRLTATSCGNCPNMAAAMKQVKEESNGRFVPFSIYCVMNPGDGLVWEDGWRYWFSDVFNAAGWPDGVINGYGNIGNYQQNIQVDGYTQLMEEAITALPSKNAIGGTVSTDGSNVNVDLTIASKESGSYSLYVFLLEDNIIHQQSGGGANYEHDFVMIESFNGISGEEISLSANSLKDVSYSIEIPEQVEDINNCHVLVWIAYDGTFNGSVTGPTGASVYVDYGFVVDNVVDIPMNGFSIFEYEN